MLRGSHTTSDMESEFSMSLTNLALAPEIETVFLMAKETYSHISGTLLRQIADLGGPGEVVPHVVKTAVEARAKNAGPAGPRASRVVGLLPVPNDLTELFNGLLPSSRGHS